MAAYRAPTIRSLLRQPLSNPRTYQRRWARVLDVRYLATHNSDERILAKYKEQLELKAKEKGLKGISELKEAYKENIERMRKEAAVPGATAPLTPPPTPSPSPSPTSSASQTQSPSSPKSPWPSPPPPPSPQSSANASKPPPGVKTLNSFLNLDKIRTLPNKEVTALWRLRHVANPQSLHFDLPASTFTSLLFAAKRHPSFVLPLPREVAVETEVSQSPATHQAAELHYLQFTNPHPNTTTLLFTTLAEFKLRGEFASPHTTITFHSELAESHGLVLGQGTVVENRGVSVDEARWLVMCMQKFYVVGDEGRARGELLEMFTRGDGGFKVERLLEEAEKIVFLSLSNPVHLTGINDDDHHHIKSNNKVQIMVPTNLKTLHSQDKHRASELDLLVALESRETLCVWKKKGGGGRLYLYSKWRLRREMTAFVKRAEQSHDSCESSEHRPSSNGYTLR
ncbi:ATP11-domain-containing protein [Byssothecium circinans]|uniref:ATP11-domain-containing protein n=1 Tax=Byssothecium circinans TaxID=147558 RepID=A0A6A5TEX7_9PLEO|nr:ATP11-domain-containing protein [Byssothecium circinans]